MSQKKTPSNNNPKVGFVFHKINYILFLVSICIVFIGFVLMMGKEDIYNFAKITLAPLVIVIGFAVGFVAILYKPKNKEIQQ